MAQRTAEASQELAARIAGFTLLALMVAGFAGMAFQGHLVVEGDAAVTAGNILAHERRFRAGMACEFLMLNCDTVLAMALYALLKPVNATLALLGSFWRIANAIVLGVGVAASLIQLDLLGGAAYLRVFPADQLHALAYVLLRLHDRGSLVGLMFFCLGAGVHSYLLWRSRYIPRVLSGLYLFCCVEMQLCCLLFLVFPETRPVLDPWFVVPDAFVELAVGLWLAFKGAKIPVGV